MAKPRSPAIAVRNEQIYALWRRGDSLNSLAEQFKISPQRVGQVVSSFHPEGDEDDERSLYRGYLWRLFDEVKGLFDAPGYKMSPTGRPAEDPNGDPAEDTNVKLQAAELELKVLESLRKLDARDRPVKSHVTVDVARQQADAWLADVAAKRAAELRELEGYRQGAVVPGEVIREIGPPGAAS